MIVIIKVIKNIFNNYNQNDILNKKNAQVIDQCLIKINMKKLLIQVLSIIFMLFTKCSYRDKYSRNIIKTITVEKFSKTIKYN